MDLLNFFTHITESDFFDKHSRICFKGIAKQEYPLLFFSLLCVQIKKMGTIPVEVIDLAQADVVQTKSKLATSFLGNKTLYWLKNINDLRDKKRKEWLSYLQEYQGPNSVAFFVEDGTKFISQRGVVIVQMPKAVDQKMFPQLMAFLGHTVSPRTSLIVARLFRQSGALSIEPACIVVQ